MTAQTLEGRVAVVTGSSRGIGRGIALALAAQGAHVVVTGTTPDMVDETVDLITAEGNLARGCVVDVKNETDVRDMVDFATEEFGGLHVLVNNAGVNRDAMFENMTEDQWDEVVDTNLKGAWLCIKHGAPRMRGEGYGRIVNIGAEAATFGNMGMVNYVAAKAGLLGLTMAVAREVGRWVRKQDGDFTCNLVMPGFNVTRMTDGVPDSIRESLMDQIVLGRVADAREDVGSAVAFLASPAAAYITGSKIGVNGGLHLSMVS